MRILATTDFSTRSQRAVRRAGMLAREASAELLLLHVVDHARPGSVEVEIREAERMLAEQIAAVPELAGVHARPVIRTGSPGKAILETAVSQSVNLIAVGAPRKRLFRALGGTVKAVLQGPYPVLIINHEATGPYSKALAPVDLSDISAKALRSALALRLIEKADVTVLHAFAALAKGKMSQVGVVKERIDEYVHMVRSRAGHELAVFLAATGLQDRGWSARVSEGSPFHVIKRSVEAMSPELLVMGTHGRSGVGKALLGSITEAALRSVNVDVLAVPPIRPGMPKPALLHPSREWLPQQSFASALTS
jgi:universal stress protein E